MKVRLRDIIRTSDEVFDSFQENQIIFQAGKTVCIKQLGQQANLLIPLHHHLHKLYDLKASPNHKQIFIAQLLQNKFQIANYSLDGQRKSMIISDNSTFFTPDNIQKIELIADEFDSSLCYATAKSISDACIFLIDVNKNKLISIGFMQPFEQLKIYNKENMSVSICGKGFVRILKAQDGSWEVEDRNIKRCHNQNFIFHQTLGGNRMLLGTKSQVYLMDGFDILQTIIPQMSQTDIIKHLVKTPSGFILATENKCISYYKEDNQELTFKWKGKINLQMEQKEQIQKIIISSNLSEVILRSNKGVFYSWKTEGQDNFQISQEYKQQFVCIQGNVNNEINGTLSMSTSKQYCLLSGNRRVSLWDLQKNISLITMQFCKYEKKNQKVIYSCAIHPDANSFIMAFQDRATIYQILLKNFKLAYEFTIKKCHNICFSHGGHFVALINGRGLNSIIRIINYLDQRELCEIRVHNECQQLIWSEIDDKIIVCTTSNLINIFKVGQTEKIGSIQIDQPINFIRIDNKSKLVIVSTNKKIYLINNQNIIQTLNPKIKQFDYIFPYDQMYFMTDKIGNLYWSRTLQFQKYHQLSLFTQHKFKIISKNKFIIAYSSFQNITMLQIAQKNKKIVNQDIVLVQRSQIQKLVINFKNIQNNLQNFQNVTGIKIQQDRKRYEQTLQQHLKEFKQKIISIQTKYDNIQSQKLKQQKQYDRLFTNVQLGQLKNISELQKMYDNKLKIERNKYISLQQNNLQQKINYQNIIHSLQNKYTKDIENIRQEYSKKLKQQTNKLNQYHFIKNQQSKILNIKNIQLQQQNQITLLYLQQLKDTEILNLKQKILQLEKQLNQEQINLYHKNNQINQIKSNQLNNSNHLNQYLSKLEQTNNRVNILQQELILKNNIIQSSNKALAVYEQKIEGLQKAKYVLNFRTTQIRKELEPKEQLISKLKSELFKLDGELKNQLKKSHTQSQRMDKIQKMNQQLRKQNTDIKTKLKKLQQTHDQLSYDIFKIINNLNQKQWPNAFVNLYRTYIHPDKFQSRNAKKKDNTSEELNRHLIHVEQSLIQVSSGNDKIMKGKDKEVLRKMKQNADLIQDLNQIKKEMKSRTETYVNELKEKNNEINRLKRQLNQSIRASTRANTSHLNQFNQTRANTSHTGTRRFSHSHQKDIRDLVQWGYKKDMSYMVPSRASRSRISSAQRTMFLHRDKSKIFEVARDLQTAKNTIKRQDRMIEELNQQLLGLSGLQ